jgi:hypothetical protein
MKSQLKLVLILLVNFIPIHLCGQINGFYPKVDTLFISSGCTPPEIICSISNDTSSFIDTVFISAGFNTLLYSPEIEEDDKFFQHAYFLINDSLNIYDYQLWIETDSSSAIAPYLVQLDTANTFWWGHDNIFDLKLIVKNQEIKIDSLSQLCETDHGVGVQSNEDKIINPNSPLLLQNYPNPSNSVSLIKYEAKVSMNINLTIYDVTGKSVEVLVDNFHQKGIYHIKWDASQLSSGIYYIMLKGENYSCIRKCSLIK